MQDKKRGQLAPFVFLVVVLSAFGSANASPLLWLSALAMLATAYWYAGSRPRQSQLGWAEISVIFLAAWMIVVNRWLSPTYTVAAIFHAAFLAGGFALGRRSFESPKQLLDAALAFGLCIAAWALWQRMAGAARGEALFEAPATFTTVVNLVLLPVIVVRLFGRGGFALACVLAVLVAGLTAADSRGGWLALSVGLLAASFAMRHAGLEVDRKSIATVAYAIAAGFMLAWASQAVPDVLALLRSAAPGGATTEHSMLGADAVRSGVARLSLYELALRSIEPSMLLTGAGYLTFFYFLQTVRVDIPSFESSVSYFVHNDYLQTLLELGIPGLVGLLAVVALPLYAGWRAMPVLPDAKDRLTLCALWAAIASMATHAVVDFPFYIPVCLVLYGIASGVIAGLSAQPIAAPSLPKQGLGGVLRRAASAAVATLMAWLLLVPVAAEAAAANAHRHWQAGQGENAAYWFEFARRLDSRDWRYHWYAGQFWYVQAAQNRKPEAASLADRAFAEGMAANPREVRNLLGRLATHRELRELLAEPAPAERMRQWARMATQLSPYDPGVRREAMLVSERFGGPK